MPRLNQRAAAFFSPLDQQEYAEPDRLTGSLGKTACRVILAGQRGKAPSRTRSLNNAGRGIADVKITELDQFLPDIWKRDHPEHCRPRKNDTNA